MTDFALQETTSFSLKGTKRKQGRGLYPLASPPPAEHVCFDQAMVGRRFGWIEIISPERRYTRPGWKAVYVAGRCTGCGYESWVSWSNLKRGKSRGCQTCSKPRRVPLWLDKRINAMRQRCTNPNDTGWKNYGGRGIEFQFSSVLEAGLWIQEHLGLEREKEIDRVDNMGHYAPGNLRYSTHSQNGLNKRGARLTEENQKWAENESPYSLHRTLHYFRRGKTREEILALARLAVTQKRKCWKILAENLSRLTTS